MDIKAFYKKIQQTESEIADAQTVIVSLETSDGGREGVISEVTRRTAAQKVVEGKARLASSDESKAFREQRAEAKRVADQTASANRVQLTVISETELRNLKSAARSTK